MFPHFVLLLCFFPFLIKAKAAAAAGAARAFEYNAEYDRVDVFCGVTDECRNVTISTDSSMVFFCKDASSCHSSVVYMCIYCTIFTKK